MLKSFHSNLDPSIHKEENQTNYGTFTILNPREVKKDNMRKYFEHMRTGENAELEKKIGHMKFKDYKHKILAAVSPKEIAKLGQSLSTSLHLGSPNAFDYRPEFLRVQHPF